MGYFALLKSWTKALATVVEHGHIVSLIQKEGILDIVIQAGKSRGIDNHRGESSITHHHLHIWIVLHRASKFVSSSPSS